MLNNNSKLPDDYEVPGDTSSFHEQLGNLKDIDAEVRGYFIQVVYIDMLEEFHFSFAYGFGMIGINEQENKICYLYHFNGGSEKVDDLDEFIKERYNFPD